MGKSLNDLKFVTFVGSFPSDGVASIAVKGLMSIYIVLHKKTHVCAIAVK